MKKFIYFFLFFLVSLAANSQVQRPANTPSPNSPTGYSLYGYVRADSGFIWKQRDTFPAKFPTIIWHTNGNFYKTNGNGGAWSLFVSGTASTVSSVSGNAPISVANGTTTPTISVDTSYNGLTTKKWLYKSVDSLGFLKLNISDTAAMLLSRLKVSDTAYMLSGYLRESDTSAMLSNYVPTFRTIGTNAPLFGGGNLSANRTLGADTGRNSAQLVTGGSLTAVKDSLVALIASSGGGTVLSVATTDGYGIVSSVADPTSTPNISLRVDTVSISTRAWRQKGIDSVQSNLTAGLALKLNLSDTAAMLSNRFKISDTLTMLLPYLRKSDTSFMLSPYRRTTTKITNSDLVNSTISGISLGSNLADLTFGQYLQVGASSYNGSAATTITTNGTSTNAGSTLVARDVNGDFSARNISATQFLGTASSASTVAITNDITTNATYYPMFSTVTTGSTSTKVSSSKLTYNPSTGMLSSTGFTGALTGNASTATVLQTPRTINGVAFDGSANISISASVDSSLTAGYGIIGSPFNGSLGRTWVIDTSNISTKANVVGSLVAKLNISDTASMLSKYFRTTTQLNDTTFVINRPDATADTIQLSFLVPDTTGKLSIIDTSAMLAPYRRTSTKITNSDLANSTISGIALGSNLNNLTAGNGLSGTAYNGGTAYTWQVDTSTISTKANVTGLLVGYATTGNLALKLNISDTATMLLPFVQYSDTAAIVAGYVLNNRFLDSLTNVQTRIQTKQPLGAYITLADSTTILAGRWLPNRSADSIAVIRALANTKLNISDTVSMLSNRLKISDTANMLSPYYRTSTATAALALKLNISDTATMLTPFVQYSDTANQTSGYLRKNFALLLQDTAAMLSNRLRISDTLTMLSNRLKISDTSNMLSPYARTANLPSLAPYLLKADSLSGGYTTWALTKKKIDSIGALKVNYTDTAAIVANRLKISDTATMLLPFVQYSDTASIVSGYVRSLRFTDSLNNVQTRIQTKLAIADTATMLSGYTRITRFTDSLTAVQARIQTKQPLGAYITLADSTTILSGRWLPNRSADSIAVIRALANSKGTGSVTSVATGVGLSGGTITTSGTISADTTTLSTRAYVTGQLVGYATTGNLALKLNISDTATMLSNYRRTSTLIQQSEVSGLSTSLAAKLNISDTATMLSGYKTYYPRTAISAGTGISYNAATGVITNSSPSSGGTVTSVATNNGSGITGGTITSTGTIAADTTILSTKANVVGLLVGYATTSSLASYKLIADTFFANGYTTRARTKQLSDSLAATKLNLTGGTLTGGLSGTTVLMSGAITGGSLNISSSLGLVGDINSTNANGGYITWETNNVVIADIGTANQIFGSGGAETFGINTRGTRDFVLGSNNTERFRLASSGAASFTSSLTANSFIKIGGLSTQFLKADGSIDGNTYLTSADISGKLNISDTAAMMSKSFRTTTQVNDTTFTINRPDGTKDTIALSVQVPSTSQLVYNTALTTDADYSLGLSDTYVQLVSTSTPRTLTLPAASTCLGRVVILNSKVGGGSGWTSTQTIYTTYPTTGGVTSLNGSVDTIISNGTNWIFLTRY